MMKTILTIKQQDIDPQSPTVDTTQFRERNAARAVLLAPNGAIWLLNVTKHAYHKLPGGGIDQGEDTVVAMKRELLEEVGCEAEIIAELGEVVEYRDYDNGGLKQISYCYLARQIGVQQTPKLEEGEVAEGLQDVTVGSIDEAIRLLQKDQPNNLEGKLIQRRDLAFLQAAKAATNDTTVASYEAHVQEYINGTPKNVDGQFKEWIDKALSLTDQTKPILELGSAFGRDAAYIEAKGYKVERTDVTKQFVEYLQKQGHSARVLNAITDELGSNYGMVFANAVFLHFTREKLTQVLSKIPQSLDVNGILAFSVKKGEGEAWSQDKLGAPRYFCYWQQEPLQEAVQTASFEIINITDTVSSNKGQEWLHVIAKKV
jgi:8-oxo-dGTP pyrophosphatase MutT (NUDIX family)